MREKLDGREMGGASRHLTRFEEDIDRVDGTTGMTLMTFIGSPQGRYCSALRSPQFVISREYNSSQTCLISKMSPHQLEKGAISEA